MDTVSVLVAVQVVPARHAGKASAGVLRDHIISANVYVYTYIYTHIYIYIYI